MALASGTTLGPYEILASLGAGGMGEVYRARDTRLERTVAIKILPAHLSSSAELKARFEREARAVSSLNHPHICHLYDIGSQDGTSFLVMEYLEGESLADRLRKGAMSLKQALEVGIQIAEALAAAHRAGILHRDLKPGNVMLTAGGAKLLDFGLAKTTPALSGSVAAVSGITPSTPTMTIAELSSPAKPLTRQGTVVGTFQYMAPEVLQGSEADARSDIFSLGCVLYEMVTGRRAFEGKSQLSVLTAILEKDPEPLCQVQPASPAALDHVVKTCLEKNPEERFQTAQDVKLQLKWIAEGGAKGGSTTAVTSPGIGSRLAWIIAGLALLGALALGGAYLHVASRTAPVVKSSILPPAGTAFVTTLPASGPAVISPDGTRLAFTARDDKGKVLLYVRALAATGPQALAGTDDAIYPFWSPDSRDIGFFAEGKVKRVSANGGPAQTLCDALSGRGGAWNKDGVILFTPSVQAPLLRVPATGGTPQPASTIDAAHGQNSHRWPHFLPDQQHYIFWSRNAGGASEQALLVGTLGSMETKKILAGSTAIYASGYLLFLRDQSLLAQPFDTTKLELTGEAMPIAEHVVVNDSTGVPEFSASESGTLVYQAGEDTGGAWDLRWFTRDGKPAGTIVEQERYIHPLLSPDNTQLAVSLFKGSQGTSDIWIFDLKRGTKSRLTFGTATALLGVWSPNGKILYYASNSKAGPNQIYAKAADGSGSEQLVLDQPEAIEDPENFSPDGRYLVFRRRVLSDPTGNWDLWALPLFGDRKPFPIVQTPFAGLYAAVSPTGKWMAYQNSESGRMEIYLTAFPGGGARWEVSTGGGIEAKWRGDGKELYFLDQSDNVMAVDVDTSSGTPRLGVPHALFQATGVQRQLGSFVVTKDGKKFLVNSGSVKQATEPLMLVTNWTVEFKK